MEASHVRLLVTQFSDTYRFYREVMALPTTYPEDEAGPYAEFELGGDKYLALFDRALMAEAVGADARPPDRSVLDAAIVCFGVDDVDREADRLVALGVELVVPPADHEPWGMRTVYVRDPDGNLVELYSGLKGESG